MLATFADAFRDRRSQPSRRAGSSRASGRRAARAARRRDDWHGADLTTATPAGDGGGAGRYRAEGVQGATRPNRSRIPDARAPPGRIPGCEHAGIDPSEIHGHVSGSRRGLPRGGPLLRVLVPGGRGLPAPSGPYGHRPETSEEPSTEREIEQHSSATLCNYCVGETAALEGASGMIGFAPNRQAKIFLATQVVDEARHLEVLLHRLSDLGVADPTRPRSSDAPARSLLARSRTRLLGAGRAARSGTAACLRAERDPRVAWSTSTFRRPSAEDATDPITPRCWKASSRTSGATWASARTSSAAVWRRARTRGRAYARSIARARYTWSSTRSRILLEGSRRCPRS